jgi:fibronectin type 3 domain-containing protein
MISMVLLCGSALLLGCSDDNPATPTTGDEAPPAAVTGLTAQILPGGDIEVSWDASTQPNLRGYNVYRHILSEQAIGKLTTSPITDNLYTDSDISTGPVYEYFVTAVSVKGLESAYAATDVDTDPDTRKGEKFED